MPREPLILASADTLEPTGKDYYRAMVESTKSSYPELGHLPTDLVMKMMETESTFNPGARSSAGAIGLMQLKPDTAEWIRRKMGVSDPSSSMLNPEVNVHTGMLYFNYLLNKYKGNTAKALQAYNVGPEKFNQGVRNPDYVRKILGR